MLLHGFYQVRKVMLSYISEKGFEVVSGGTSVVVPSSDPLYKNLQLKKFKAEQDSVGNSNEKAASVVTNDLKSSRSPDADDAFEFNSFEDQKSTGDIIAGVYMPSISDIIEQVRAPMSTMMTAGSVSHSSTFGNTMLSTRELLAERGTGKPVELPRSGNKSNQKTKSRSSCEVPNEKAPINDTSPTPEPDTERTTLNSTEDLRLGSGDINIHTTSNDDHQNIVHPPVVIQKKDIVKEALNRFSRYYAIINPSGKFAHDAY